MEKAFLETLSDLELVILQKDLRTFPEDKDHLNDVINELKNRATLRDKRVSSANADNT